MERLLKIIHTTRSEWVTDHDALSYEHISHAFDGHPVGDLTRDEVLDSITLTWFTNTGVSSGRLSWENSSAFSTSRTFPFRLR